MSFEQWANVLTQGGWVVGSFAILFGYFKGIWIGGAQHLRELAEKDKEIERLTQQCSQTKADADRLLALVRTERDDQLKTLRVERDEAIARAREREEKWERVALTASGLVEKMGSVTGRAVNILGLQQEEGAK